jgi:hypothetical protein
LADEQREIRKRKEVDSSQSMVRKRIFTVVGAVRGKWT